jgi:hypothetical protein
VSSFIQAPASCSGSWFVVVDAGLSPTVVVAAWLSSPPPQAATRAATAEASTTILTAKRYYANGDLSAEPAHSRVLDSEACPRRPGNRSRRSSKTSCAAPSQSLSAGSSSSPSASS